MSLYSIQQDILDLFHHVEENGGEITDAQLEFLEIKQEELNKKLDSYNKAIANWKADMAACKDEEKRIHDRRKVYENRIERLKKSMLNAVLNFGDDTKSGGKCIELATSRLSTRRSVSTVIDDDRCSVLANAFRRAVDELYYNGVLETGDDIDLQGLVDSINANVKAERGEHYTPFTIGDFLISVNVTTKTTLKDILKNDSMAKVFNDFPFSTNITFAKEKDEIKTAFNSNYEDIHPTVGSCVENISLTIK